MTNVLSWPVNTALANQPVGMVVELPDGRVARLERKDDRWYIMEYFDK